MKLTTTHIDGRVSTRHVEQSRVAEVAARLALDPNTALVTSSMDDPITPNADLEAIALMRFWLFN